MTNESSPILVSAAQDALSSTPALVCDPELALTYPPLMRQALAANLRESDLQRLRQACELALTFSDGLYRATGVPLINHLIRTASILMLEKQPVDTVIVGLLHAIPQLHKFTGSTRTAGTSAKHERLREEFGNRVADMVMAYGEFDWRSTKIFEEHISQAKSATDDQRLLLTVGLANELEDRLDFALIFSAPVRESLHNDLNLEYSCQLSEVLGLLYIGRRLRDFDLERQAEPVPAMLRRSFIQGYEMPRHRLWQRSRAKSLVLRFVDFVKQVRHA